MFPRLLRPPSLPASRRAYSFFSSKSGGGRYFNSAKPPKVVAPAAAPSPAPAKARPSDPDAKPAPDDPSASASSAAPAQQPAAAPALTHAQKPADTPSSASASASAPLPSPFHASASSPFSSQQPFHPQLSPHDLKLHQFFSLHRPLFLNTPPTALFDPTPAASLTGAPRFPASDADADADARAELAALDDPPEASLEADADAARQLARALVINSVGAAIAWDDTLRRLGIPTVQISLDPAAAAAHIRADSTKRKRRKKMKKHKCVSLPSRRPLARFLLTHRACLSRLKKRRKVISSTPDPYVGSPRVFFSFAAPTCAAVEAQDGRLMAPGRSTNELRSHLLLTYTQRFLSSNPTTNPQYFAALFMTAHLIPPLSFTWPDLT